MAKIEIHTERLVLRPLHADDAERMALLANDERVARNLSEVFPYPYATADAVSFIGSDPSALAVVSKVPIGALEPGFIGVAGADPGSGENDDVFEVGYWFAFDAWGQGFATEATRAFVDHLLTTKTVRRLEALVYAWNPGSARVLEKVGFELEGRTRSKIRRFGEVTDELIYGYVPDTP